MEVDDDIDAQQQQTSRKLQRIISSDDNDKTRMRDWNNPSSRIIRVSRASGGKDRHSKVLTSKGLRDRRIRLSVATAIQFYDLQDRLGFDQPSKAVEWLINAASDSISELPPINNTSFDQALSLSKSKSACSSGTSESSLLSLSRTESRGKARERARERTAKDKDLQNAQSSFTQLLTGGFDEPNRNWIGSGGGGGGGGSSSDCFNPVQLIPSPSSSSSLHHFNNSRQETSLNHHHHQNHFSFVPDYNFGISSSDSPGGGCYTSRGTLQSNSHSLFLNNNNNINQRPISFVATPPPLDHHSHQLPATFDGRLYLYYGEGNRSSEEKGKDGR